MRYVLAKPDMNTELTVVDELEGICYVVQFADGGIGYMKLDGLSATKNAAYYGGGGGGGGGTVWTPPEL